MSRSRGRKFVAVLAAIVGLGGVIAATATAVSAAATTPVDVGNDSIQCNQLTGKITFAPPLTNGGTAAATAQVRLKINDCADDLQPSGVVAGGTVLGSLALASNDCTSLDGLQGWVGSLTAKWRPVSGVKLSAGSSTIGLTQVSGGVFGSGVPTGDQTTWGGEYGLIQVGTNPEQGSTAAPTVTGAFTGGSGGADSTLDITTNETDNNIQAACASTSGLTRVTVGIGSLSLG